MDNHVRGVAPPAKFDGSSAAYTARDFAESVNDYFTLTGVDEKDTKHCLLYVKTWMSGDPKMWFSILLAASGPRKGVRTSRKCPSRASSSSLGAWSRARTSRWWRTPAASVARSSFWAAMVSRWGKQGRTLTSGVGSSRASCRPRWFTSQCQ
ncbi:hypothetical protein BC828DRAFT_379016 [Blastocladiella britannica]|nr:hypothetical protein BC828DRAFT_379016 [Blastocladiella britannica]